MRGVTWACVGFVLCVESADAFTEPAVAVPERWGESGLRTAWRPVPEKGTRGYSYLPGLGSFRGASLRAVTGQFSEKAESECTTLLFFDAGYSYGFNPTKETADGDKATDAAVEAEYQVASENARNILRAMNREAGGGAPIRKEIGAGKRLRFPAVVAEVPGGAARLIDVPGRLVEISFFPDMASASRLRPDHGADGEPLDRSYYASRVKQDGRGDVTVVGIPMLHQGNRAYCGVSALAMAAQYFHLNLGTEAYAAAAGFRKGNDVALVNLFDTYEETVEAAGFQFRHRVHFDFKRVRECIVNGLPVLVWRRYDAGRDGLHSAFAKRYARDPDATLPAVDEAERSTWPIETGYKHASLITGYNEIRGEVIFTESWGEHARNRRMRIEEMAATSYLSFYPE